MIAVSTGNNEGRLFSFEVEERMGNVASTFNINNISMQARP